jgi:hypothetical protein
MSSSEETFSALFTDPSGVVMMPDFIPTKPAGETDLSGAPIILLLSIDDLLNSHESTVAKETVDRTAVATFTTPSVDILKPALFRWAAAGFPGGFVVNTLTLAPPALCSDGVSRLLTAYFEYLYGSTFQAWLQTLETLTNGMTFTFSHDGANVISLHVSRK